MPGPEKQQPLLEESLIRQLEEGEIVDYDARKLCLTGLAEPKPANGAEFTKQDLRDLFYKSPPDDFFGDDWQTFNAIQTMTAKDLKGVSTFAGALKKEPPDFAAVDGILNNYRHDPEKLSKMIGVFHLATTGGRWAIESQFHQDGELQVSIHRGCPIAFSAHKPPEYLPETLIVDNSPTFSFRTDRKSKKR